MAAVMGFTVANTNSKKGGKNYPEKITLLGILMLVI